MTDKARALIEAHDRGKAREMTRQEAAAQSFGQHLEILKSTNVLKREDSQKMIDRLRLMADLVEIAFERDAKWIYLNGEDTIAL